MAQKFEHIVSDVASCAPLGNWAFAFGDQLKPPIELVLKGGSSVQALAGSTVLSPSGFRCIFGTVPALTGISGWLKPFSMFLGKPNGRLAGQRVLRPCRAKIRRREKRQPMRCVSRHVFTQLGETGPVFDGPLYSNN